MNFSLVAKCLILSFAPLLLLSGFVGSILETLEVNALGGICISSAEISVFFYPSPTHTLILVLTLFFLFARVLFSFIHNILVRLFGGKWFIAIFLLLRSARLNKRAISLFVLLCFDACMCILYFTFYSMMYII